MKKAALYARVSTGNQSTGLEAQILALKTYCERNEIFEYELFVDEGVSGAKSSRPGLDALLKSVEAGNVCQVVTYSLSRLSRSTSHLLQTLERLENKGVGFKSISEAIDLSTPAGRLMMMVLGAVGEMERALVIERVNCGLQNAKAKGIKLGAPKRFINTDLLIQLASQKLTYREIAKLVGCSTATVCRELKRVSQTKAA